MGDDKALLALAIQDAIHARCMADIQTLIAKTFDALKQGNNPDQALRDFKAKLTDLRYITKQMKEAV